jgi:hypothetical protein
MVPKSKKIPRARSRPRVRVRPRVRSLATSRRPRGTPYRVWVGVRVALASMLKNASVHGRKGSFEAARLGCAGSHPATRISADGVHTASDRRSVDSVES